MRLKKFLYLLYLCAPVSVLADQTTTINIPLNDAQEVTTSSEPYVYSGPEINCAKISPEYTLSLQQLFAAVTDITPQEQLSPSITTILQRFNEKHLVMPKAILVQALKDLKTCIENNHQKIADDGILRALATQIEFFIGAILEDALTITYTPEQITPEQTVQPLRAPREPLALPGDEPNGNVGDANLGLFQASGVELPRDVNIDRNFRVGNDANITHDLNVGNNAVIDGTLTIQGGILLNNDLVLQPIAPDTSIAVRFNTNTGSELGRIYTPSTNNGLAFSTNGGATQNLQITNTGNLDLDPTTIITVGGNRYIHHAGTNNFFAGINAGNLTNTATDNVGVGNGTLINVTTGIGNTGIGRANLTALTSGNFNTALGVSAGPSITTGNNNTLLGIATGTNYTGAETENICLGAGVTGATGESYATRIGKNIQTSCYIGGVNQLVSNPLNIVGIDPLTDRLGTSSTGIFTLNGSQYVTGNLSVGTTAGGLHVGGISAAGDNNLLVDGTATVDGDVVIPYNVPGSHFVAQGRNLHHLRVYAFDNAPGFVDTGRIGTNYYQDNSTGTSHIDVADLGTCDIALQNGNIYFSTAAAGAGNPVVQMGINTVGTIDTTTGTFTLAGNRYMHEVGLNSFYAGTLAGTLINSGVNNTGVGVEALTSITNGQNNTAVGRAALQSLTSGSQNTAFGYTALQNIHTGAANTGVGYGAGSNYTLAESNNICIGNGVGGAPGESNTTRIGVVGQTSCFIGGVNQLVSDPLNIVGIDPLTDRLGTSSTGVFTLNGSQYVTGDLSVGTTAGGLHVGGSSTAGDNNLLVDGTATVGSNVEVLYGLNGKFIAQTSNNAHGYFYGWEPAWFTDAARIGYNYYVDNVTGTPHINNNVFGTCDILMQDGAITFSTAAGGAGNPVPRISINSIGTLEIATGKVTSGGLPYIHQTGNFSFFAGSNAGNFTNTGTDNTGFGVGALYQITSGSTNTALGRNALQTNLTGTSNTAVGAYCLNFATGSANTAIGDNAGRGITGSNNTIAGYNVYFGAGTGSNNVIIGYGAGTNYAGAESNNIVIGTLNTGTSTESNTIRIQSGVNPITACYIGGIYNSAPMPLGATVLAEGTGHIGILVSSIRFKENIQNIESNSNFMQLRPVSFNYKNDPEKTRLCGFIAEEVAPLYPDLVINDAEGEPYTIKYQDFTAILTKEIQQNHLDIASQGRLVTLLQQLITQLQQQNTDLEQRIAALESQHTPV